MISFFFYSNIKINLNFFANIKLEKFLNLKIKKKRSIRNINQKKNYQDHFELILLKKKENILSKN